MTVDPDGSQLSCAQSFRPTCQSPRPEHLLGTHSGFARSGHSAKKATCVRMASYDKQRSQSSYKTLLSRGGAGALRAGVQNSHTENLGFEDKGQIRIDGRLGSRIHRGCEQRHRDRLLGSRVSPSLVGGWGPQNVVGLVAEMPRAASWERGRWSEPRQVEKW